VGTRATPNPAPTQCLESLRLDLRPHGFPHLPLTPPPYSRAYRRAQ
jgi:hypothetical protein